jgi:hypothetical protein
MKPLTTDFLFNETGCINSDVLLKYRDHQLTEVEKHAVEEHLVDCELCSDALDGLAKVHAATLSEVTLSVKQLTLEDKKHPGRKLFSVAAVLPCELFPLPTVYA